MKTQFTQFPEGFKFTLNKNYDKARANWIKSGMTLAQCSPNCEECDKDLENSKVHQTWCWMCADCWEKE